MAINLRILTHTKTVYEETVLSVSLPASGGMMGVLPRHLPFVVLLDIGIVTAQQANDVLFECLISSGIAYLINDDLTVFAEEAETFEAADLDQAHAAFEHAKRWGEQHRFNPQVRMIGEKLLRRAENRIKIIKSRKEKNP